MIMGFRLSLQDKGASEVIARLTYANKMQSNLISHPFSKSRLAIHDDIYILQLEPSWFRLDIYGWVMLPFLIFMGAPWFVFIPIGIIMSLSLFWLPITYKAALLLGLWKRKSKAKVSFISSTELVEVLTFGAD